MKISTIISSVKIAPELVPLIIEILTQASSHDELDCRVVLLTQYSPALMDELKNALRGDYENVLHINNTNRRLGYFATFNLALQQDEVIDSDIFAFMNDDIIIKSDFLKTIKQIKLDRPILYSPLVFNPDGKIQLSVFRKDYSKLSMFFRRYDEGLYSRLARFLRILDTGMENLNRDRYTVPGCCFIMNHLAVTQMQLFKDEIFLYYEEVFLRAMVRKFKWECMVLPDVSIVHIGGRTLTRKFTQRRSHLDKQSAMYVAKGYLGFNSAQLFMLWVFKWSELCIRQLVNLLSKCFCLSRPDKVTMPWLVFEKSVFGHRGEYADVFSKLLNAKQITGFSFVNTLRLLKFPAVLFSSCDDYIIRFFFISLLRRCRGFPSVAIATRVEAVFKAPALRIQLKRIIYKLLKKSSHIKIVSIMPFCVEPRLEGLADDWIYDPQFWDISYLKRENQPETCVAELFDFDNLSKNKLKLVLPGNITKRKGAEFMIDIFLADHKIRQDFLFILGGEVLDIERAKIHDFERAGGFVLGFSPAFSELINLYTLSDIIWCCYPQTFNHSSGIFGRSLQFGVPVIVRKASYLSRFDIPCTMKCVLDYGDIPGSVTALNKFKDQMNGITIKLCSADKFRVVCGSVLCKK